MIQRIEKKNLKAYTLKRGVVSESHALKITYMRDTSGRLHRGRARKGHTVTTRGKSFSHNFTCLKTRDRLHEITSFFTSDVTVKYSAKPYHDIAVILFQMHCSLVSEFNKFTIASYIMDRNILVKEYEAMLAC